MRPSYLGHRVSRYRARSKGTEMMCHVWVGCTVLLYGTQFHPFPPVTLCSAMAPGPDPYQIFEGMHYHEE